MAPVLSILDKSPIPAGATASEALQRTIALAKRAEELGYYRYWVAEHHGTPLLASSAPEIVVAHLLAQTSRIRVGSGGVMLQHYSPYKVAETFKLLSALAPGRVDLGIGKAPGGLPVSTRALQSRHDKTVKSRFEDLVAELEAFLTDTPRGEHVLAGPVPPDPPRRILLGGSPASAELAASHDWDFVFAGHFNGDPDAIQRSITTYRQLTGRPAILALNAFAAATREKAAALVGSLRIFKLHLATGQSINLPSLEAVAEFARQAGVDEYRLEETKPHVVFGTPDDVRHELETLARRYGVEEFVLDNPVSDFAERAASLELLASAHKSLAA